MCTLGFLGDGLRGQALFAGAAQEQIATPGWTKGRLPLTWSHGSAELTVEGLRRRWEGGGPLGPRPGPS